MRVPGRLVTTLFVLPVALPALLALPLPAERVARAQTRPSLDLRTWRPSTSPEASLVLEPVTTPGPWQWNAGAWLHYAQAPVVLHGSGSGGADVPALAHVLGADLVAGIGLGDRAAVGIDLPFFLWQDGASVPPGVVGGGSVPTTGLGDLAVQGKATVVSNDRQGLRAGFGLGALAAITLPTGDRRGFAGDDAIGASLVLLGEYALGVGGVRASLGYRLRTAHRVWPDPGPGSVTVGDEIPWSIGIFFRPKAALPSLDADDRQIWEIAATGALPAGPVAPFGLGGGAGASLLSPALLAADDRVALGHYHDAYLLVGAEIGLDRAYGTPDVRAVVSLGWAPRPHDRDGDGVPDDADECPDLPEDRDGIQDSDGCPEDDADGDGVPDTEDACPLVPGVAQPDPKANGCPEKK